MKRAAQQLRYGRRASRAAQSREPGQETVHADLRGHNNCCLYRLAA